MNHLGIAHLCVLTTNKALAELVADLQNGSGRDGTVKVVAAHGSWAVRNIGGDHSYAIVDWKTLKVVGWEHLAITYGHRKQLSGPWMGDVPP